MGNFWDKNYPATDDPLAILGFNELPSNESKVVSTAQTWQ